MALDNRATIFISDYRYIIRELNKVDAKLVRDMKRDYKSVGSEVRKGIKSAIPAFPPLSGFAKKSASGSAKTWGNRFKANTVRVRLRSPQSSSEKNQAILQLQVVSPATVIADMAGRGSDSIQGQMTKEYDYRGGKRRHRVNGQGKIMIDRLNTKASGKEASRYVYPAAEEKMPEALEAVRDIVSGTLQEIENNING